MDGCFLVKKILKKYTHVYIFNLNTLKL
jgi:hypothetical protein